MWNFKNGEDLNIHIQKIGALSRRRGAVAVGERKMHAA
jgi:hypothetical protein